MNSEEYTALKSLDYSKTVKKISDIFGLMTYKEMIAMAYTLYKLKDPNADKTSFDAFATSLQMSNNVKRFVSSSKVGFDIVKSIAVFDKIEEDQLKAVILFYLNAGSKFVDSARVQLGHDELTPVFISELVDRLLDIKPGDEIRIVFGNSEMKVKVLFS